MDVNRGFNQPPLQENCQFKLKRKETGRYEGRLLDFRILQNRTRELLSHICVLFFKTREEGHQGNLESIKAASSISKGKTTVLYSIGYTVSPRVIGLDCWKTGLPCQQVQKAQHQAKEEYFSILRFLRGLPCSTLDLLGTHHPSFFSYFSLLKWKCPSHTSPNIVFWNHITCLISQIYSCRRILPQDESYLGSHPYSIYIVVR